MSGNAVVSAGRTSPLPAVDTGSAWARRIYERRLAENESSSKKLDTAGCQPTNKGRSGLRMRSAPTWMPRGCGAPRARSSWNRNAQPRQEALRRRPALGDHRLGGLRSSNGRGTTRHREPHDQHGRWCAVARAQVLRPALADHVHNLPERQHPVGCALTADGRKRRKDRPIARRIQQARFHDPDRTPDAFDLDLNQRINWAVVRQKLMAPYSTRPQPCEPNRLC